MPELPEVETVKRGLVKLILYKKFIQAEVREPKSAIGDFKGLIGAELVGLRRFGKALVMDFNNDWSLMIHLRMTGQLIWQGEERFAAGHPTEDFVREMPSKHTRVILEFDGGKLYFNDQRKFGFCKVLRTVEVGEDGFIKKLAKEPWGMEVEEFWEKLQRRKNSVIKAVLLDQTVIAGLGNIYTDETLFDAGVDPRRKAGKVSRQEAEKILEGARKVMQRAIDAGGSTMATYVRADGTKGSYLEEFAQVFQREGQACFRCGTEIKKIRVAGRGTYFCPRCQK